MAALPPNPALEFSFPIDMTQLAVLGRDYALSAKDADRARVAKRLDLLELPKLTAEIHILPSAGGLIQVTGRLKADVVQRCIVSLEPVAAHIDDEFALSFVRAAPKTTAREIDIEPDDDGPEIIQGEALDLGEVVVEQLALLIDPYPRAPGAVFRPEAVVGSDAPKATVSPFAVLAKLKTKSENK